MNNCVTKEQIAKAREMDLLTYLETYEPGNLKHECHGTYSTRDHDSLKISNGKWYWFSQNIGGYNALDYLLKVRGASFVEAVQTLTDGRYIPDLPKPVYEQKPKREFHLPPVSNNLAHAGPYLLGRGLSQEVIDHCFSLGILREDLKYHNCLFLGYDGDTVKFAAARGTEGNYKRDLPGSDKHYSFCVRPPVPAPVVHIFEAAIDAMSYATLEQKNGNNWKEETLLSLSGVYASEHKQDVPAALKTYLERNPQTTTVVCHLDNDAVGRAATRLIGSALSGKYTVIDSPAKSGKDYNDYLQNEVKKQRKEKER